MKICQTTVQLRSSSTVETAAVERKKADSWWLLVFTSLLQITIIILLQEFLHAIIITQPTDGRGAENQWVLTVFRFLAIFLFLNNFRLKKQYLFSAAVVYRN